MLTAGLRCAPEILAHEQDDRHHHQPGSDDRGGAADGVRERFAHHAAAGRDQHQEEGAEQLGDEPAPLLARVVEVRRTSARAIRPSRPDASRSTAREGRSRVCSKALPRRPLSRRSGWRRRASRIMARAAAFLLHPDRVSAVPREAGTAWSGQREQDARHRVVLGRRDPESPPRLHRHLPGHEPAPVRLPRREPGRGVAVALLRVRGPVDREQVERVVGKGAPAGGRPARRTLLPRVRQRHDVIDLHRLRVGLGEHEHSSRVRVDQPTGHHHAAVGARPPLLVVEIAVEDVVTGVATVPVDVGPRGTELLP